MKFNSVIPTFAGHVCGGDHVHVAGPGDHYSPATGSAIMTIIYEMARARAAAGGRTLVTVSKGTRHDYPAGECIEVGPTLRASGWRKAMDVGLGRLGFGRPFGAAAYVPASRAIPRDFAGPVFLHNSPAAIAMFRRHHPRAFVCLWANNELFRTYSDRELRRIVAAADKLICCSQFIADRVARRAGDHPAKICVVRNGADVDRFRPSRTTAPNEIPMILFVGRVIPEKGADLLIAAAAKIRNGRRRFELRIVGSSGFSAADPLTPYERQLRRAAQPLGNGVTFMPFTDRERVVDEFQRADIFCLPSNWDDPCPLTLAEAMACGLPVVASRRGGIPEMGGDDVLYFRPPDLNELADQLAALVEDPPLRSSLGERARRRAELFSWPMQYRCLLRCLEPAR